MAPRNEFPRPLVIEPWPDAGVAVELVADPAERRALARRFGLLELPSLRVEGRLERGDDSQELRFRGWLEAEVVQACVVTLEPVPATIRLPVERRYRRAQRGADPGPASPPHQVWVLDGDEDEIEVDIVSGRTIDLGEAMAEELALALDPYPRAAEADDLVLQDLGPNISVGAEPPAESPFAALRQLAEKRAR
ncbi:MAG TPA: DUF177 domain-containing protein [Geminicoccaceae bacterium]|nr:DUF177 domain-containing protein [Geminicoccaceae bacterium]